MWARTGLLSAPSAVPMAIPLAAPGALSQSLGRGAAVTGNQPSSMLAEPRWQRDELSEETVAGLTGFESQLERNRVLSQTIDKKLEVFQELGERNRLRAENADLREELEERTQLRMENASLHEELRRIELQAASVEEEVRRGRVENDRLFEELLASSATDAFVHAIAAGPARASVNGSSAKDAAELAGTGSEQAISQCGKSESDLLVEGLAAQLRAEMESLRADGREVCALAARREMELRRQLSRTVAEEHAEAQVARRVRETAARKVAAARKELDEVVAAQNEQAVARFSGATAGMKPLPGTIVRARYEKGFAEELYEFPEDRLFSGS